MYIDTKGTLKCCMKLKFVGYFNISCLYRSDDFQTWTKQTFAVTEVSIYKSDIIKLTATKLDGILSWSSVMIFFPF